MSSAALLASRAPLGLMPHAADVWVIDLERCGVEPAALEALSADEIERANRFVFDRDRRHFVTCRAGVRRVLSQYAGLPAEQLRFGYGERGKPFLASQGSQPIEFNVSHASGLAVVAVTTGTPVGVDVESVTRKVEYAELAQRFFSAVEAEDLLSLPAADLGAGFFACWTRKEAYIKAIGDGLACPLDSFAVTLRPGDVPAFRWIASDDAAAWTLRAFEPASGYVAALASRGPIASVTCRRFEDLRS